MVGVQGHSKPEALLSPRQLADADSNLACSKQTEAAAAAGSGLLMLQPQQSWAQSARVTGVSGV